MNNKSEPYVLDVIDKENKDYQIKFITIDLQKDLNKESISEIAKELKEKLKEWTNGNDN